MLTEIQGLKISIFLLFSFSSAIIIWHNVMYCFKERFKKRDMDFEKWKRIYYSDYGYDSGRDSLISLCIAGHLWLYSSIVYCSYLCFKIYSKHIYLIIIILNVASALVSLLILICDERFFKKNHDSFAKMESAKQIAGAIRKNRHKNINIYTVEIIICTVLSFILASR